MVDVRIERPAFIDLRLEATVKQKAIRTTKSWMPVAITSILAVGTFIAAGFIAKYLGKIGLADRVIFPVIASPALVIGAVAVVGLVFTTDMAVKNHRLLNYLQEGFEGTEEKFKLIFSTRDDIRAVMSASILEYDTELREEIDRSYTGWCHSNLSVNEKQMLAKIRAKIQELNAL